MSKKPEETELQRVLATLAQFAGPVEDKAGSIPTNGGNNSGETNTYDARYTNPTPTSNRSAFLGINKSIGQHNKDATTPTPPVIDPATITTWQDGLRCVTKIAARNVQFAIDIKTMIADQKSAEMRWYSERQQLKRTQANRKLSRAKARSIISSINNDKTADKDEDSTKSEDLAELAQFDLQVYEAQQAMEKTVSGQLKSLGVPFFGTDTKFVISDEESATRPSVIQTNPKWSQIVTESELLALRRRMIEHLEDLYKD